MEANDVVAPDVAQINSEAQTPPEAQPANTNVTNEQKNLMDLQGSEGNTVRNSEKVDNLISMDGDKKSDEATAEAEGAPESYEKFTTPEGMELNDEEHATYSALFKECGLSQSQAQKLVDAYNERIATRIENHNREVNKMISDWQAQVRKEPDFAQKQMHVRNFLKALNLDDAEKQLIANPQFSNNPVVFSMFEKAGKLLSEDRIGGGGMPTPNARDKNPYKINLDF